MFPKNLLSTNVQLILRLTVWPTYFWSYDSATKCFRECNERS